MRSNVVISRNGNNSLHQYWISKNYIDRNWDLILLFYERKAFDNFNTSEGVSKFFIEVMAPCVTKKILQEALEDFKECESGIGLDHLWGNYFNYELKKMAILDEISMKHTRPVGGPLYDYLRSKNIDHMDELRKLLKKYSQRPIRPYVYEGLTKTNQTVKNKFLLGYLHLKEYYSKRNEFNDPKHTLKKLLRLLKYYFIYFIKT